MDSIAAGALDPTPRTFDDDELDTEVPPEFRAALPVASWSVSVPITAKVLVFAVTPAASGFVQCMLPADCQQCGILECEGHGTWTLSLHGNVVFAACEAGAVAPTEIVWKLVGLLAEGIQFQRAIILDSVHSAQFMSGTPYFLDGEEMSTLRHLRTSNFQVNEDVCPAMEAPNVVDGLSAALITHCQLAGIPAAIFVVISSEGEIGLDVLHQWDAVMPMVGLQCPDGDRLYKEQVTALTKSSTVYT